MRDPLAIRCVRATAVRVARLPDFLPRTAKGSPTHSEYALVEVETAGGVIGVGEATTAPAWNGEDAVGTADLVGRVLGPELSGLRVDDWSRVAAVIDSRVRRRPFLRCAIEAACLDAEGRIRDLPAAAILGEPCRRELATKIVLPARDPDQVEMMAKKAIARGATALKVKVGLDPEMDIERVRRVRSVVGERLLSVDANEGWRADRWEHLSAALRDLDLVAVEQPFPRTAIEQTANLRRSLGAAVVADESVWDVDDLMAAGTRLAFSDVSLYPGKVGGLRRCVWLAALAHQQGFAVSFGSNLELGVGAAAMAQVMAVIPQLSTLVASDLIGPLYFEHSLVIDPGFIRYDGASVPKGSGLGVELDRDALRELAIDL